jgi:ketosteroid isomerase-like protein
MDGDQAGCTCSALIQRAAADGTTFDTAAQYTFRFRRGTDDWRIDHIQQKVLWNRGDPRVHGALRG